MLMVECVPLLSCKQDLEVLVCQNCPLADIIYTADIIEAHQISSYIKQPRILAYFYIHVHSLNFICVLVQKCFV